VTPIKSIAPAVVAEVRGDRETSLSDVAAKLARRWATQRLAAVQNYGRILADFGDGRSSGRAAMGAFVKLAAEEAIRYPADAIGLATDYAAAAARQAGVQIAEASPSTRGVGPVHPIRDLDLQGPLGGEARVEFILDNPHDRPSHITFITSPFWGPDGEIKAPLVIEPASFVLGADEARRVSLGVTLNAEMFQAGAQYTTNVAISGFEDLVLRLRLTILQPA
jgi:hypothetical protein